MSKRSIKIKYLVAAVSVAMLQVGAAWAEDAQPAVPDTVPAAPQSANDLNLDKVIVTGTPVRTTKMKSSISISTLDAEQIQMSAPTSSADVLRSIPGVHSEASAGEGNTNVTVRGIPISAGGARYVQFQEDGLPVLQNGDYAFVTPDMYVKIDGTLDHVEAVRGGSASVLGSNSPGGIINFLTKTGEEKGGSIGISKGLGFDQTRYDFDYGGPIADKTRFFIGGFYRTGEGARNGGVKIEDGGQIKANITHELGDGSFIRVSYKHLDDKSPLDMPVPFSQSVANPTKANPATIGAFPGFDPRTGSYYSPYWSSIVGRDKNNGLTSTNINDGLTVKEDALGFQGSFKLGDGWTLDENFRKSQKTGAFLVAYPTAPPFAAAAGTIYASGPNKGQAYSGNVLEVSAFDATFDDIGNTVNALKIAKTFDLAGSGKLTAVLGWDNNLQNIGVTQNLPHYLISATDNQPVMLSGLSNSGVQTDAGGLLPDSSAWGHTTRALKYSMSSPYLNLAYEMGALNIDGGVRQDSQKVTGSQTNAGPSATFIPGTYPSVSGTPVNYDKNHTSYSLGGNYRINPNLSGFARYSDGASFNVVERMGGPFDGTQPITINTVKQAELGVKWRQGGLSTFVTFFNAKTAEGNFDLTTGILSQNTYSANGVEIESAYRVGGFNLSAGLTYTDAKIVSANDPTIVNNQPHRLAKYIYQVTPSYRLGDFTVGGSVIGTAKSFGDDQNTIIQPGFETVNFFTNYQIDPHASISLSANNVFNKIGWTEYDSGQGARSINGRTVRVALKYTF